MDSPEEALAYDATDHGDVNRLFVSDLIDAGFAQGKVLDLGTGTAQIPIELCRRTEKVRVVALDLSRSMLDQARKNIDAAGMSVRITLDLIDAKKLPYEDGRFDVVMHNSDASRFVIDLRPRGCPRVNFRAILKTMIAGRPGRLLDLTVEVDITRNSRDRLTIYAVQVDE